MTTKWMLLGLLAIVLAGAVRMHGAEITAAAEPTAVFGVT